MLPACLRPSILTVLWMIARWLLAGLDVVIMDYRYEILEVLWGSIVLVAYSTQFPQALLNFGQCDECQLDAERVWPLNEGLCGRKFHFAGD